MQLTEEQQAIVHHQSGHALVSAVAGSGKTTTMVARVHHLLKQGVAPNELLVLMFNRSARDTFAAALSKRLAGTTLKVPEVRTYHSLGLRLVESFTRRGVLPAHTLVTDARIREKLAKQTANSAYKQENGDHAWVTKEDLEEFLRFIDLVKAGTTSAEACFEEEQLPDKCRYFIESFQRFERARRQQRIRFYEDLLHEPLLAMLQDNALASWVSNRVEHVIVDEYQDINEVQQRLLKIMAGKRAHVMVVGDVDQCIYVWRGARPDYITSRFQNDFIIPQRYTLSYTFRYGHRLSLAANHLISKNNQRDRKLCLSAPDNYDTRISLHEETPLHPILKIIDSWCKKGRALADAAVLVRLFSMSVPVELALLEAAIPYRLEGHEQVFSCREVKALIGYLKFCSGTLSDHNKQECADYLLAMLSQPHLGIRQEELQQLAMEIAVDPGQAPERIVLKISSDLPVFINKKIAHVAESWEWLLNRAPEKRADLLLAEIISHLDLYEFYRKFSSRLATAENRIETCRAFVDFAARQKLSTKDFLAQLEMLQRPTVCNSGDFLLITSIHRAKGLEWPLVVVPGLRDGSFPFVAEVGEGAEGNLEDERRLFYVAMTRAIEEVALIHPPDHLLKTCARKGSSVVPLTGLCASRFLYEANLELSDQVGAAIAEPSLPRGGNMTAVDTEVANDYLRAVKPTVSPVREKVHPEQLRKSYQHPVRIVDLAAGVKVMHKNFGDGVINEVLSQSQGRIRVQFREHGEKTLLLSFAPLTLRTEI